MPRTDLSEYEIVYDGRTVTAPLLSIVTTVFDRVQFLRDCTRSVNALKFHDCEQLVVADGPSAPVLRDIEEVVRSSDINGSRRLLVSLTKRRNDWGMSPAAVGLQLARGSYIAFLSDDNGYHPDHFEPLIEQLQTHAHLGFVYSSCLYAGRWVLNHWHPSHGYIDLGQPLFRAEILHACFARLQGRRERDWDWNLIELLLNGGIRWRHISRTTFVFRLHEYPEFLASLP